MAIQPIDLQTLFTQVDKIGKEQAAQKDGLAMQQAILGIKMEQKTEAQIQAVNKAQDSGEGAEKVKERKDQKHDHPGSEKDRRENENEEEKAA